MSDNAPGDPVLLALEACLRERSGGTMKAAVRDVWLMAKNRLQIACSFHEAASILGDSEQFQIKVRSGEPMMVEPRINGVRSSFGPSTG